FETLYGASPAFVRCPLRLRRRSRRRHPGGPPGHRPAARRPPPLPPLLPGRGRGRLVRRFWAPPPSPRPPPPSPPPPFSPHPRHRPARTLPVRQLQGGGYLFLSITTALFSQGRESPRRGAARRRLELEQEAAQRKRLEEELQRGAEELADADRRKDEFL